jgi:hypothetical protein
MKIARTLILLAAFTAVLITSGCEKTIHEVKAPAGIAAAQ